MRGRQRNPAFAEIEPTQKVAQKCYRTACIARALVRHGRTVQLAGLDNGAGLLCAKALDLPPDSGRTVLADLLELRNEIDQLTAAVRGEPPP